MNPLIAIVGSADTRRTYDPPLRHAERVSQACAELGRELATRGCDIMVYNSDAERYVEADLVRGYVASGAARPGSIQIRAPHSSRGLQFEEAKQHRALFDPRPDTSGDWEVSYYRSLVEADGVLLVGGGWATYGTGLILIAFGIPAVPVATFGGNAEKVWQALDRVRNHAHDEDLRAMVADWDEQSAASLVTSLLNQRDRRAGQAETTRLDQRKADKQATISLAVAAVLILLGLATIPAVYAWTPGTAGNLAALIAAPVLVAPSGAIIRTTLDRGRDWWRTAVLGMIAGAVSSLLFIAAQVATTPSVLDGAPARRLLLFIVPVGFIAGLTFDAVYTKLRHIDIADITPVNEARAAIGASTGRRRVDPGPPG